MGIIKRNWRTRGYCGSLQPQEERGGLGAQGVLFCPVERRFPKIRLQTRQVGGQKTIFSASVCGAVAHVMGQDQRVIGCISYHIEYNLWAAA